MDEVLITKIAMKVSLRALFAIGVKEPKYVDKFMGAMLTELEKELIKIPSAPVNLLQPTKNLLDPVKALDLSPFLRTSLVKAGLGTVGDLMAYMQENALTSIKGVKEKSAKQILEAIARWNR